MFLFVIFISGCLGENADKTDSDDGNSNNELVCNAPYIQVGKVLLLR